MMISRRFPLLLLLGTLAFATLPLRAATYTFDAFRKEWYQGDDALTAVSEGGKLKVAIPPSDTVLVHGIGTKEEFPTPDTDDWAGVEWSAPAGEIVTHVRMVGTFRRERTEEEDFGVALFGGTHEGNATDNKLHFSTGVTNGSDPQTQWSAATQTMSYDWSIPVDPEARIGQLQIRVWQAVAGGVIIQGGSDGYSGQLRHLEITTQAVEEGSANPPKASGEVIKLGNANVSLQVDRNGKLLALEDHTTKTSLLTPKAHTPAWSLFWRGSKKNEISVSEGFEHANAEEAPVSGTGQINAASYPAPQVELKENEAIFIWTKEKMPTVTGKITFEPKAEQFRFSATVENHSSAIVERISFPASYDFPALKGNYAIVCADNQYHTDPKPLESLKPFVTMYPGYMFMQLAGFKIGKSAALLYTDDDKGYVKWMSFGREGKIASLDLSLQIRLQPGKRWKPTFDTVLKVLPNGDYSEMADAYAQWGRQQWWAKESLAQKVAKRPMLERYIEGGLIRFNAGPPVCDSSSFRQDENRQWHYIKDNRYSQYEPYYDNILTSIEAYEKAYDIRPGYWYPNWSGHQFDSTYPDYFPVLDVMGDFDKFHREIIERRYPMMYHINPAQWAETAPTAKEKKYLAVTDSGSHYQIAFVWSKMFSYLASPAVALEKEMETINRLRDDEGYHGVYLDVIGHAFATDENPLSPYHGEPHDYQLQKILHFKTVREAIKGPLMTEARNEIELAYMDMGTGAHAGPETDEIPLWEMVYGDLAATTTYAVKDKAFRYHTWMRGGVMAINWDWPTPSGNSIPIHLTSLQQTILSPVITERLERFVRLGESRLSQWKSGIVLWNKAKEGEPVDIEETTTIGKLKVKQLVPGGMIIWSPKGFLVDGAASVSLDGKELFTSDSDHPVSVSYGNGRWIIEQEKPIDTKVRISVADSLVRRLPLEGKQIKAGTDVAATLNTGEDRLNLELDLPGEEAILLYEKAP